MTARRYAFDDVEMTPRRPALEAQLAGTMFDAPAARHTDPATSHDAAASMEAEAANQRARILHALVQGDLTADDCDRLYGWRTGTAGRRMKELRDAGLVARTDRKKDTAGGRAAHVYTLAAPPQD